MGQQQAARRCILRFNLGGVKVERGGLFVMSEVPLYRGTSRINAFSAVLSTEGRVVGLCWAN